ncbi:MAG: hypothetical protein ABR905_05345 [Terracidiphilus sp.]
MTVSKVSQAEQFTRQAKNNIGDMRTTNVGSFRSVCLVFLVLLVVLKSETQTPRQDSVAGGRDPQEKALNELDRLAQKAHARLEIEKEIELRRSLSAAVWTNYQQHSNNPGRWDRWAIVYENDLPLALLLEGSRAWAEAEAIFRRNQSALKHERLAGNDIKSENDLHLAHLLLKEGKQSEAETLCAHWKNKVKHNADFAIEAVRTNTPTPPLYDAPEVEIGTWKLACERPEDGLRMLKDQTEAHPGMLAPFTAMANYYTSEGDFRTALAIDKDGTSALMSTPDTARK